MADYDKGEITDREQLAADRQKEISRQLAADVNNQLARQVANYQLADQQNRGMRDLQYKQNRRKAEADRFEAQRNLRNSALGLLGTMDQAMNGSALGNLMYMLRDRTDADNQTYWNQLQANNDAVGNSYLESLNQNRLAQNDAAINAEKAIRDIESDLSANLSNINPNLYIKPGTGDANLSSEKAYNDNSVRYQNAALSGYLMPELSRRNARSLRTPEQRDMSNSNYFGSLMNQYR